MVNTGNQGLLFACGRSGNGFENQIHITAESGSYRVKTPYNAKFVERLKMLIPRSARGWG